MADADHFIAGTTERRRHARREEVVNRMLLCAVVAGLEGLAAAILVFAVALLYHVMVLQQAFNDFASLFYLGYALLAGVIHASFAAHACSRLLEQPVNARPALQHAFFGWTATVALVLLTAFLLGQVGDLSRVSLTSAYLLGIPVIFATRSKVLGFLTTRIRRGELHFETIALIGKRTDVLNFLAGREIWRQGHKLQGTLYLEDIRDPHGHIIPDKVSAFATANLKQGTDQIVFVGSVADLDEFDTIVDALKRYALNLLYAPASRNRALKLLDVVAIGPNNVVRFVRTPMSGPAVLLKRSFDFVFSALGLLLLSPLLAVVALAIMIESRGPVIYRQARRGFNGDTFMIWKFRSMRVAESGYDMKQARKNDPRVTRIGRLIRATSIDELPQLVNVLVGQMSLVGPRPHAISHDEQLSRELADYAHRQRIKPGITGWAQVNGFRGETTSRAQIEGRVSHDIYYIDNWSLLFDVWILILTVFSPATRRNAH